MPADTIRPPALRPGDTIGIVSPSWGGAGLYPERAAQGVAALEAMGFRVRFAEHARESDGYVSATPERRAADLHAMFADPEVRAIIAAIGGDHSCHLLPLLDFDRIRANPTIFMGFSDITVLNVAIWQQTGLVTFNGPGLMTDIAEYPEMPPFSREAMQRVLCEPRHAGPLPRSDWWTEEFLDWDGDAWRQRPRARQPSPGWTWLKEGRAEGILVGGCLESLQHLRGTPYWPSLDAWSDAILFIETSEEKPEPAEVDGLLMDLENMGVLERIRGLLVGRPMLYSNEEKAELRGIILERTKRFGFPIVTGMDFGHTTPSLTLPVGVRASIDTARREVAIVEAAVAARS